jgi:hypothetical protein
VPLVLVRVHVLLHLEGWCQEAVEATAGASAEDRQRQWGRERGRKGSTATSACRSECLVALEGAGDQKMDMGDSAEAQHGEAAMGVCARSIHTDKRTWSTETMTPASAMSAASGFTGGPSDEWRTRRTYVRAGKGRRVCVRAELD